MLGRNGRGKTTLFRTLFRTLCGMLKPLKGAYEVTGSCRFRSAWRKFASRRRRVGNDPNPPTIRIDIRRVSARIPQSMKINPIAPISLCLILPLFSQEESESTRQVAESVSMIPVPIADGTPPPPREKV